MSKFFCKGFLILVSIKFFLNSTSTYSQCNESWPRYKGLILLELKANACFFCQAAFNILFGTFGLSRFYNHEFFPFFNSASNLTNFFNKNLFINLSIYRIVFDFTLLLAVFRQRSGKRGGNCLVYIYKLLINQKAKCPYLSHKMHSFKMLFLFFNVTWLKLHKP